MEKKAYKKPLIVKLVNGLEDTPFAMAWCSCYGVGCK